MPQGGLGRVAIDGTKIKANASKHKAAMARDLAACIPGARLLVPPEVRHCSVVEAAALLAPELEAFLTAA